MTLSADTAPGAAPAAAAEARGAVPADPAVGADGPLDLAALAATPVATDPFPHVIVPGFLKGAALAAIERDFPAIDRAGSFPPGALSYGPAFAAVLDALEAGPLADAIEAKFGVDLADRPTMVTVRGMTRPKDGQIHTDSTDKLITALLYMNGDWEADGGRLRLLRSADDLEDYAAEVPPVAGTLLVFVNGPTAWHGHKPFAGRRRTIQLNWVTDAGVVTRERRRHGLSAALKRLNPFG